MSDLYTLPTPGWGSASDVSADGSVVIGFFSSAGQELNFRWTQAGGMQDLGALPGGNESYATDVSADGSIVVGKAYYANSEQNRPFYWTKAGGMKDLGVPPGAEYLWATGISADGSLVILDSGVPNFYRWTQAGGFQAVPAPIGAIGSSPWGVSGDGSVVVGDFKNANGQYRAFRWTKSEGSQDLNKLLPTLGVDLTGWTLEGAEAVSSDGSTIVGQGLYKGAERAFAISGFPAAGKKLQKASFKLPSKMVYDGSYALRATFNCKGPVTYSVDDVTAAQVTGSQLKIRKADAPFNVFARQAGDSTWAAAEVQAAGTGGRRPQRIAWTVKSNATVGQTLPLSVTVNSPLAVDVTSSDSGIVRVNGDGTATALAKGSAVLTAMQNGDTNHAPAKSLQKTVTVR
jgi:probable HAF family extracellular repeat protein